MLRRLVPLCSAFAFAAVAAPPATPSTSSTPATPSTTPAASAPTKQEKLQALASFMRLYDSKSAGAPVRKPLAMAITMVVFEMATGAEWEGIEAPTPEQLHGVQDLVASLKQQGVDVERAVQQTMQPFEPLSCRSKQTEAKANLKALLIAEESHRVEFDTYDKDMKTLGFEARGKTIRYRYEVVQASESTFMARATGIGEMKGDVWEITQDNHSVNVTNSCSVP